MATRRQEQLARLLEEGAEEPTPEGLPRGTVQSPEVEQDFPFELVEVPSDAASDSPRETRPKDKGTPKKSAGRSTASERQLQELGETLEEKITVIFALASGLAPVTSVYATENSDKAIRALLAVAKRRPKVLAALTKVADGADAMEIGKFLLGLIICIQVDAGRLKGDELPARAFGVTEIIQEHFMEADPDSQPPNPNVVPVVNSAFQPI